MSPQNDHLMFHLTHLRNEGPATQSVLDDCLVLSLLRGSSGIPTVVCLTTKPTLLSCLKDKNPLDELWKKESNGDIRNLSHNNKRRQSISWLNPHWFTEIKLFLHWPLLPPKKNLHHCHLFLEFFHFSININTFIHNCVSNLSVIYLSEFVFEKPQ